MMSTLLSGQDLGDVRAVVSRHRGTAMPEPFVLTEELQRVLDALPQKPGLRILA
jgi:hypothetical protein